MSGVPRGGGHRGSHPGPPWSIWTKMKSTAVVGVDLDVAVGQVAGPDGASGAAKAKVHREDEFGLFHVGSTRVLGIGGDFQPFSATRMSPKRIVRRSRSALAPDLPMAATMRPQFGSSPATAVSPRESWRWRKRLSRRLRRWRRR